MSTLQRIRQKILRGEYFFSIHALEELENDNFTTDDAVCAILNGEITEKLTYDIRGTRPRCLWKSIGRKTFRNRLSFSSDEQFADNNLL